MIDIKQIVQLMPPPSAKLEAEGHDWNNFALKIGCGVPSEYMEFLSVYGTGVIGDFLWVLNPFSLNPALNIEAMFYFREAYQIMSNEFPDEYPRTAQGSFLTWAVTDNGDSLFWSINSKSPNDWTVGIHGPDQSEEELFDLSTFEFIESILTGKIVSSILPTTFIGAKKSFLCLESQHGNKQ